MLGGGAMRGGNTDPQRGLADAGRFSLLLVAREPRNPWKGNRGRGGCPAHYRDPVDALEMMAHFCVPFYSSSTYHFFDQFGLAKIAPLGDVVTMVRVHRQMRSF